MEVDAGPCVSADTLAMFQSIIDRPDVFYKSQQRSEPELKADEKLEILQNLWIESPATFLQRYHGFLTSEHVSLFENQDDFDVKYYLGLISKGHRKTSRKVQPASKNRRYVALRKLIKDGEFFSDWEMRKREPLLYEQMVGQFLTQNEMAEKFHSGEHSGETLSGMFTDFAETQLMSIKMKEEEEIEKRYEHAEKIYDRIMGREQDEDSESEMEDEDEDEGIKPVPIDSRERDRLREEFLSLMHERFLSGKDTDWLDYGAIDHNPAYDPLDLMSRDAEDAYFDSELAA